jgi:hypothetical protein
MLSAQQSITSITAGLLVVTLGASIARADSACRGLVADRCGSQSGCLWVKGYTRKDGKAVSGYCRTKGGKPKAVSEKDVSAEQAIPVNPFAAKLKRGG